MAKKNGLTQRQQDIYDFLKDKILTRGYGPTVREIGTAFEIRSPNGVMCHLKALEKKGLITRESHMSRDSTHGIASVLRHSADGRSRGCRDSIIGRGTTREAGLQQFVRFRRALLPEGCGRFDD